MEVGAGGAKNKGLELEHSELMVPSRDELWWGPDMERKAVREKSARGP